MSTDYDSFTNRGEYFAAHYFAEQLPADLKKGLLATWTLRESDEHDPRSTPRQKIRELRADYLSEDVRGFFAESAQSNASDEDSGKTTAWTYENPEWVKKVRAWHQKILGALGFVEGQTTLTVHRSGHDHAVEVAWHGDGIVAIECGWTATNDSALDAEGAGQLLYPLRVNASESYETGQDLASWLFQSEMEAGGSPPRFVILLCGGVIVLADRQSWAEGRFLAANLDAALERNDRKQLGELATISALFSHEILAPREDGKGTQLDELLKSSGDNAVGVSKELREGLQRSVEIIANEVLARLRDAGVEHREIEDPAVPFARQLTRESLRYLYRILFLLYAEARPELGILPADDGTYEAGYSVARLRELIERDEQLVEEESRNGFHLFASLEVLIDKVNNGHRPYGSEPGDDQPGDDEQTRRTKASMRSEDRGLRFEPLRSELFERGAIRLIGRSVEDPRCADDAPREVLDLRLRNSALHEVLRLLTMKNAARRGDRGGFISYRNLGINQLGAVYEGLMSYTGVIAEDELCEVAKKSEPEKGSWLIPAHRQTDYPESTLVTYDEHDARKGLRGPKRYKPGTFVYRLAGRDRETSASYYTPESLTKVTVELALKHLLDQEHDVDGNVIRTPASKLLEYKICEPALGSGAFLNEAINQVAEEYLRRRQDERGVSVPTDDALTEKQRVKAYIALHNAYGVDLNATGVELAEVSLWLNTMHPGMQAPWFGLHLRRGNSLIGARRAVYSAEDVVSPEKPVYRTKNPLAPTQLPFRADSQEQPLPDEAVHQFLLPSPGWAAITGSKEARALADDDVRRLNRWRSGVLTRPKRSLAHLTKAGEPKLRNGKLVKETRSQFTRLRDAARRVEFLWSLVIKRMEISEQAIARRIDVWGADPKDPEFAFLRRPEHATTKEQVFKDLFNAVDTPYWRLKTVMDAWCALWFWPGDKAGQLDGSDPVYLDDEAATVESLSALLGNTPPAAVPEPDGAWSRVMEMPALFAIGPEQGTLVELADGEFALDTREVKAPTPAKETKPELQPRRVVPLKDLDDWLDFLEAMLGDRDIEEGTFIQQYDNLEDLKEFEDQLPSNMGMHLGDPEQRFPWLHTVRDIAKEQGFLHWELEFAIVFARCGGFDLQVGNPPWNRPEWQQDVVLAEQDPILGLGGLEENVRQERIDVLIADQQTRNYAVKELTSIFALRSYLGSPATYPLLVGLRSDLYRAFMCGVWSNGNREGVSALVHPDTHFEGPKERALRAASYARLRIHGSFVNGGNWAFASPISRTLEFGVHVYGAVRSFVDFDHISHLYSADTLRMSLVHDGSGDLPGIKYLGDWDVRPHRARVIRVNNARLDEWRALSGALEARAEEATLRYPVSSAESSALEAIARFRSRLADQQWQIARGFNETLAERSRLIESRISDPGKWEEVILKGPQFGIATPIAKQPPKMANSDKSWDLTALGDDAVPPTTLTRRTEGREEFVRAQEHWTDFDLLSQLRSLSRNELEKQFPEVPNGSNGDIAGLDEVARAVHSNMYEKSMQSAALKPYSDFYRLAWREMIPDNGERSLFASILPPGVTHVHSVRSMAMRDSRRTVLQGGFWASLVLDYCLRASGRKHLDMGDAQMMPYADMRHPLAASLLVRTLRLNCITSAYANLWEDLYDPTWVSQGTWAFPWPGLRAICSPSPLWTSATSLRTEYERRAALVEIDALVAVWLDISADGLVAAYRSRYGVMADYEQDMYFDSNGRRVARRFEAYGYHQANGGRRQVFDTLIGYLADPERTSPPEGYTAPFYKADRESEMRAIHAVFQARLDAAVARGEWDPVRQEVPR